MTIKIPKLSLVTLIGPTGSGKSTFASKHFLPTEVLSSDICRGLVSDDENDQAATKDAFEIEILHEIAAKWRARGRLPECRRLGYHVVIEPRRNAMSQTLIIRGRYADQTFIPDGPLPEAEGPAELVITPAVRRSGGSVADAFGAAPVLRSGDEILAQVRADRNEWSDR